MPQIALYARVSTQDQNIDAQVDALTTYAKARGFEVVETYVDHGVSGAKAQRPALDRLMADAKRRRFDVLAVVKLDRLARSVRHLTELGATFEALGIDLVVLNKTISVERTQPDDHSVIWQPFGLVSGQLMPPRQTGSFVHRPPGDQPILPPLRKALGDPVHEADLIVVFQAP